MNDYDAIVMNIKKEVTELIQKNHLAYKFEDKMNLPYDPDSDPDFDFIKLVIVREMGLPDDHAKNVHAYWTDNHTIGFMYVSPGKVKQYVFDIDITKKCQDIPLTAEEVEPFVVPLSVSDDVLKAFENISDDDIKEFCRTQFDNYIKPNEITLDTILLRLLDVCQFDWDNFNSPNNLNYFERAKSILSKYLALRKHPKFSMKHLSAYYGAKNEITLSYNAPFTRGCTIHIKNCDSFYMTNADGIDTGHVIDLNENTDMREISIELGLLDPAIYEEG